MADSPASCPLPSRLDTPGRLSHGLGSPRPRGVWVCARGMSCLSGCPSIRPKGDHEPH